jgi:hypothetical protein
VTDEAVGAHSDAAVHGSATTGLRVSGPDEAFLLAEEKLGFRTPIQFCWVLDDDPGLEAIERYAESLSTGLLHRAISRRRFPAARRRWVSSRVQPRIIVGARIDDAEIGAWADNLLRSADLRPAQGLGWRVHTTTTTRGRRVVVLLLSHLIADGEAIMRALVAAADGETTALADPDTARGARALAEDARDSARQIRSAARSVRAVARDARQRRRERREGTAPVVPNRPPSPPPTYDPYRATLAIVDVDRDLWHAQARQYGGTGNTLFTALVCGLVRRSGYPVGDQMRVSVAVSKRGGPEDLRANASGGIWLRVGEPQESPADLDYLRGLSRQAFAEYAKTGTDVPDDLQSLVRLMPRRVLTTALRSVPAPDVSVSNLGVLDDRVRTIAGVPASSFVLRLMVQDTAGEDVAMPGPGLSAWIVEYGSTVTLSFAAFSPEYYGDEDHLAKLLSAELSAWGLDHRFW